MPDLEALSVDQHAALEHAASKRGLDLLAELGVGVGVAS
jgi:hypothetical protein